MTTSRSYDVAVIGGSFGGVAAALAAADAGATVALTESTDWIGGQVTNQGVSALDEHEYIEQFGGTDAYSAFREQVRAYYRSEHDAPGEMSDGRPINPGNGWVSRLCFEPRVGLNVLEGLLEPYVEAGRLDILRKTEPIDLTVTDDEVTIVTVQTGAGETINLEISYVLDATDFGDLLPMASVPYRTGAEAKSDTGEAHAPPDPCPDEIQSFTYCFAVEHRPGEDHTIVRPDGYRRMRDEQPYTFEYVDHAGVAQYQMFEEGPDGELPFWTYRRIADASLLEGIEHDIALVNWSANDYHGDNPLDAPPEERERIHEEAKRLAKGFLYWLQTDAPRDDGGTGYPGLRLLPSVMGTEDGLSKRPYVREGRRIIPEQRIMEGDIAAASNRGSRARNFEDAVAIGYYGIDIHGCVGNEEKRLHEPTRPYQVPLGALLPADGPENFVPACKNIGTTHLTNAAYRLHPTEWAIGEAAGTLVSACLEWELSPSTVVDRSELVHRFQYRLLDRGIPIAWTIDVPPGHELFKITQLLFAAGAIPDETPRTRRLRVEPDQPLTVAELHGVMTAGLTLLDHHAMFPTRSDRTAIADCELVESSLESAGVTIPEIESPPTWRNLCAAFEPPVLKRLQAIPH